MNVTLNGVLLRTKTQEYIFVCSIKRRSGYDGTFSV